MDEKKKDLIPVAAIALFLVIIIILCAVRLTNRRKEQGEETTVPAQTGEYMEAGESLSIEDEESEDADSNGRTSGAISGAQESESGVTETKEAAEQKNNTVNQQTSGSSTASADALPAGWVAPEGSISSKDPFAGAADVDKTNEEMLAEMAGYWAEDRMSAVEDLSELAWFRKMSASIIDQDTFYYYGERNEAGQPDGIGIAVYAENEYYYGSWVNGKREGQGEWFKKYVYYDNDASSDRAYQVHMYMGEWKNDLPNGMGQEHIDLDMSQAANSGRYVQNVIGTFQDGLYSGEMYLTTLDQNSLQEEWNGYADGGIWSPYGSATNKKEIPVCQNAADDENYMWLAVRDNKDRGIGELLD